MKRSNCILFALALRARRRSRGRVGWLTWRWTRLGPLGVHCLYVEAREYDGRHRQRAVSYKPLDTRRLVLPPLLFAGRAAWGDRP